MVLVEILDHTNIVVLDILLIVWPRHRIIGHLLSVEASRIGLDHILNHLIVQILRILHVRIVLFCNVNTIVQRLKPNSGGSRLLLVAMGSMLVRLGTLVVVIWIV